MSLLELAASRPLTVDDLLRLSEEGDRVELIDGALYVTPLADLEHQNFVSKFVIALAPHLPHGQWVLPGANVIAETQTVVVPDVVIIDRGSPVRGGLGVSPKQLLLAVEITSPSTRRRDLTVKRDLYREWEVPLVIVDRKTSPPTFVREGEIPAWVEAVLAELREDLPEKL